jgi:succinate dehydrogenase / fumarate reductase, membrane anchor subunit
LQRPHTVTPTRQGANHVWRLHVTSAALLVLVPLALGLFIWLAGKDHATVAAALARPYISAPLGLLAVMGTWHMALGMRTIIEDYIRKPATLRLLLGLNILFSSLVLLGCLAALSKLTFGI